MFHIDLGLSSASPNFWGRRVMLTQEQRSELSSMGAPKVRAHLQKWGRGQGADIGGFKCGFIVRSDIVAWLIDQSSVIESEQLRIQFWMIVAALIGISGVIAAVYFGFEP